MGMRVDAARHDEATLGVERAVALQALADRLDRLALDQHVCLVGAVRGDDRSAFNDERHLTLPNLCFCARTCRRSTAAGRFRQISALSRHPIIRTMAAAVAPTGLKAPPSLVPIPST